MDGHHEDVSPPRLTSVPAQNFHGLKTSAAHAAALSDHRGDNDSFDNAGRPLVKSNSILSHKSIPFTGTYPIGNLKVVLPADSISEGRETDDGTVDSDAASGLVMRGPPARGTAAPAAPAVPASESRLGAFSAGLDALSDISADNYGEKKALGPSNPPALRHGDVFLVLGLQENFQMGCDSMAMGIRPAHEAATCVGLRDLPEGAHFFWVSPPAALSRQGYWFVTKPDDERHVVRTKQWDSYSEVLGECASQFEARTLVNDIETHYPKLIPYASHADGANRHDDGLWDMLTSCLTEPLLSRVTGKNPSADRSEWPVTTVDSAKGELAISDARKFTTSAEFCFLFPRHEPDPYRLLALRSPDIDLETGPGATSHETRAHRSQAHDTTRSIIALLETSPAGYVEDDIVGELQFVFLTGVLLSNLTCLEQWWHLVLKIVLRARHLATSRPGLSHTLVRTIHAQLIYLERHVAGGFSGGQPCAAGDSSHANQEDASSGIFEVKPQGAARLRASLTAYKRRLNDALLGLGNSVTPEEAAVGQAFSDLEAWLWKYGWDLRSDYVPGPDEDAQDDEDDEDDELAARFVDDQDHDVHVDDGDFNFNRSSQNPKHYCGREAEDLYDSEDDEDQPVLVELDDAGRQVGLVSWD